MASNNSPSIGNTCLATTPVPLALAACVYENVNDLPEAERDEKS